MQGQSSGSARVATAFAACVLAISFGPMTPAQQSAPTGDWTRIDLPGLNGRPHPGVARPCWGESAGVLLLAGGSNFPDTPTIDGGAKVSHPDIFALDASRAWRHLPHTLPEGGLSESIPVTTPAFIACLGGTAGKDDRAAAFGMRWDPAAGRVVFSDLPSLPVPFRMGVGVWWNGSLYAGTGRQRGVVANQFFRLNLDRPGAAWIPMTPLPGMPREQAVAAVVQDANGHARIAVFGGNGVDANGGQSALTDGYTYDLSQGDAGVWEPAAPVMMPGESRPVSLLGASALTVNGRMLVAGGFDKDVWDEAVRESTTLTGDALAQWRRHYLSQPPEAFHWNRRLLLYGAAANRWRAAGDLPFEPRCGAAMAVLADRTLVIASGEIKPGIRTPACFARKLDPRW